MSDVFDDIAAQLREEGVGAKDDAGFVWQDGALSIRVDANLLRFWQQLVTDFADLLNKAGDTPTWLDQRPYEDSMLNEAWALLAGDDLRRQRRERCETVLKGIAAGCIEGGEVDDWLRLCNEIRMLVLGPEPDEDRLHQMYEARSFPGVVLQVATVLMHQLLAAD